MKNLTPKQIEQVKKIKSYTSINFHGNKKKQGDLCVDDIKNIVHKKTLRELSKNKSSKKTEIQKVRELLKLSLNSRNTNYFKVLIEGNCNIYYAHPNYGHNDYNKSIVFEKNPKNLKLMKLFNNIINK